MRYCIVIPMILIAFSGCTGADKREVAEMRGQLAQIESRLARVEGSVDRVPVESLLALEIARLKAERAKRRVRWNDDTLEIREIDAQIEVLEKQLGSKR